MGISLLSGLSYVNKLGFYADDWAVWGRLSGSADRSLGGLLRSLGGTIQKGLGVRPAQVLYQTFAFRVFGFHALPYHICITVALASVVGLFYLLLREVGLPRCVALLVPLVYGLLPHYASDRFWVAAHQAILSQAIFFLGLNCAVRALRVPGNRSVFLKAASIACFALALLFYEVILPLLAAFLFFMWYWMFARSRRNDVKLSSSMTTGIGYFASAAVCLGTVLLYKTTITDRVGSTSPHLSLPGLGELAWNVASMTAKFNFIHYGIGLPREAVLLFRSSQAGVMALVVAAIIAIAIWLYLNWSLTSPQSPLPGKKQAFYLILVGVLIFVIDYVPFFALSSNFSYDGTSNRVTICAAIGAAFVLTGGIMLLAGAIVRENLRSRLVNITVALVCGLNVVCIASFAQCWARAYAQQRDIVREVRDHVPLPPGSTLLLDGFCRYTGPAPVIENGFDASGAMRIAYGDNTIQSDVVSPAMEVNDDSIRSTFYGVVRTYGYGSNLWLYNAGKKITLRLQNAEVARAYFSQVNPDMNSKCPVGVEGIGSPIK